MFDSGTNRFEMRGQFERLVDVVVNVVFIIVVFAASSVSVLVLVAAAPAAGVEFRIRRPESGQSLLPENLPRFV